MADKSEKDLNVERGGDKSPTQPSNRRLRLILSLALLAVVVGYVWYASEPPVGPFENHRAPDFSVMNLDGEFITLADVTGKPVLINFWATWCLPCLEEMPVIQSLHDRRGDEFHVVAVSDETLGPVSRYIERYEYTFPVYLDVDRSMHEAYLVQFMPTSLFLDAQGIVRGIHIGAMNEEQLEAYLDQLIASR